MTTDTLQLDARLQVILEHTNADKLKKMVSAWGGSYKLRKEECITFLCEAMRSPENIRRVLAACTLFERAALAVIKSNRYLPDANAVALCAATLGVGVPSAQPTRYGYGYGAQAQVWLMSLFEKGLLLAPGFDYDYALSHSYSAVANALESDPRVQAEVKPIAADQIRALEVNPTARPQSTLVRRPQAVSLSHSAFLRTLAGVGGLKINRTGERRIASASTTKLNKMLEKQGWDSIPATLQNGKLAPFPMNAYLSAAIAVGMMKIDDEHSVLTLVAKPEEFLEQDFVRQTELLLVGLANTRAPLEMAADNTDYYVAANSAILRSVLLTAFTLLPDSTEFITIESLSMAIFKRIGEYFSLNYRQPRPDTVNYGWQKKTQAQIEAEVVAWHQEIARSWCNLETPWLESALGSWAYGWGLVELGLEAERPTSFRLTDMGRAVLGLAHSNNESSSASKPIKRHPQAWVVQPNFDVLVYLDRVTPQQLAVVERYAERAKADQHMAHYRLTRQSIYEALERDGALDVLINELLSGSVVPLPQNVLRELQGWAAMREQVTLRQLARLLEYPSTQARDEAVAHGQIGQLVGDRFLLLAGKAKLPPQSLGLVDYARPLPPCLTMTEDGLVTLDSSARDVLITGQLSEWTERVDDTHWRLTQASVSAAVRRGLNHPQFAVSIQSRLKTKMPSLLQLAVSAWAGVHHSVEVEQVIAMRCNDVDVIQAIARSTMFKKLLRGSIAPNVALIDAARLEDFNDKLHWLGIAPTMFSVDGR